MAQPRRRSVMMSDYLGLPVSEAPSPPKSSQSSDSGRQRAGSRNSSSKHEPIWSKLKTAMCRNLQKNGNCPYEETCWYAHSEEEIRSAGDEETGKAVTMKIKTLSKRRKNANRAAKQKKSSESESSSASEVSSAATSLVQAPSAVSTTAVQVTVAAGAVMVAPPLPSYFYSMPPPRQHIPFMYQQAGPNGLPVCSQYEKGLIFDNAHKTMLNQETVVINVRQILADKEAELARTESRKKRKRLHEDLRDIRNHLKRETELFERTKADLGQLLHAQQSHSVTSH